LVFHSGVVEDSVLPRCNCFTTEDKDTEDEDTQFLRNIGKNSSIDAASNPTRPESLMENLLTT
jgi:hypothetical protein